MIISEITFQDHHNSQEKIVFRHVGPAGAMCNQTIKIQFVSEAGEANGELSDRCSIRVLRDWLTSILGDQHGV